MNEIIQLVQAVSFYARNTFLKNVAPIEIAQI